MSPPAISATLQADQMVLAQRVTHLEGDLHGYKATNDREISKLKHEVSHLGDEVWKIRVKISGYSALAGVITALLLKTIDHFWK